MLLRRLVLWSLLLVAGAAPAVAQMSFVALLTGVKGELYAVRPAPGAPVRWVAIGETVEGFTVVRYEAAAESLVLRRGDETRRLSLPTARVQPLARDEVLAGLCQALNLPAASSSLDLLHPRLRDRYRSAVDAMPDAFREVLRPEVQRGIRSLSAEETKVLAPMLDAVERAVGQRPAHAFWTRAGNSFSLSFVVPSGSGWYLVPGAEPGAPDVAKLQPSPPAR